MKHNGGLVALAALSGAAAVIAGAIGAHGATGKAIHWLETGSHYQLLHAVAALAILHQQRTRAVALLFLLGGLVFAGALYALALGGPRWLGAIAPLGGTMLIIGWAVLALTAWRK